MSTARRPRRATRRSHRLGKPCELWNGKARIPIERFGSDHWHVLIHLYESDVITRTDWRHGPTLLRDAKLYGHTDLDVFRDLAGAGLVHIYFEDRRLSVEGSAVRQQLVTHLRARGNYANFTPDVRTVRMAS